jgi:hypothetical protein
VGRPPHHVRRFYESFVYQAQSWNRPRRVVAKVEWHPGELYPRVGFIVMNLRRSARRVVAFYNGRGTAEQYIKEGKNAVKWTRLSCTTFRGNAVRLQLHALAYNLANFLRTLALPGEVERWSLTSLREKVVKIGSQGDRPRALRDLPDGGGGGPARTVRAHPRSNREAAPTGHRSVLTREQCSETRLGGRGTPVVRASGCRTPAGRPSERSRKAVVGVQRMAALNQGTEDRCLRGHDGGIKAR